jgi:LysR family transcriptional regulator, benzoate and cis,cis-muconate-responsive activator of ben and cat genes
MNAASLDLRHLRYFVAVAEELHFGRAAQRLGISQPPLSEQIRGLESAMGVSLFTRTRRHVALTAPGRVLYGEATRLIAHAERVASVMTGARTGRGGQVFLGCVPSGLFGVLPRILEGRDDAFEIRVTEAHTADIVAAVVDGRLDCGLVWEDRAPGGLALRALERVRFTVAVPVRPALAGKQRVTLRQLALEPLIVPPRDVTPHQFDRIHAGFRDAGVTPRIGQHARSIAAQLGFVASGLGYALVPEYATKLAMPGVVFLALREALDSVPLSLVWDEARASPQLDAFRARVEKAFPHNRGSA